MLTENQLAPDDVERYNVAHEQWFARMPNLDHVMKKPFGNPRECAEIFQQLGRLFAGLRLSPGMTVLDFGCGTCWMTEFLNKMGMHVVGLDVSQTALDIGRQMLALDQRINPDLSIELLTYDSHRIPLENESVDRVMCFSALHHVANKIEILQEIYRVMKPDAIFGLADAGIDQDTIPQSVFERETWGVLEDNLQLEELQEIGQAAGFSDMYLTLASEPHFWFPFRGYGRVGEQRDALFDSARKFSRHFEVFFFTKGDPLTPTSATPDCLLAQLDIDQGEVGLVGDTLSKPLVVRATNTGNSIWLADTGGKDGQVNLGMHLFTAAGELMNLDYFRMPLQGDVHPGQSVEFEVRCLDNPGPGNYLLEVDLVDEGLCWFKQWGTEARRAKMIVTDECEAQTR
jgi:ubiquinone/menaquinone biosynthesis C-methylase UbiE